MILMVMLGILLSVFYVVLVDFSFMMVVFLLLVILFLSMSVGLLISKWFFGVVALVFLGGMMVLFFYCLSLSKSDKPYYGNFLSFGLLLVFMIIFPGEIMEEQKSSLGFYASVELSIILFLALYLIFTLLLTVKISENFKGSLMKLF